MARPSYAEVRTAVINLYQNPAMQPQADQWLTALQDSDHAIEVGLEVLKSVSAETELRYIGATMVYKAAKRVPVDHKPQFALEVLHVLPHQTEAVVIKRVCLAIAVVVAPGGEAMGSILRSEAFGALSPSLLLEVTSSSNPNRESDHESNL